MISVQAASQFTSWQGTFVVDDLRGAASSDPALAWEPE
jgi:hypothetical protein